MNVFLFFILSIVMAAPLPIPNIFGLGIPCEDHLKESSCIPYCACAWDIKKELCVMRSEIEGESESLASCDHNALMLTASAGFLILVFCFCVCIFCICCLCCVFCISGAVKRKKIRKALERYKNHPLRSRREGPGEYNLDDL